MEAIVYTAPGCHACEKAVEFLKARSVDVETRDARQVPDIYCVPTIDICGRRIPGFNAAELLHVIAAGAKTGS
jgi:hypothetical protein